MDYRIETIERSGRWQAVKVRLRICQASGYAAKKDHDYQ